MKEESLVMVLRFNAPLRATKPNSDLVEQHMESFRGRIIPFIRREYGDLSEDELSAELERWKNSLLSVFPRKRFSNKRGEVEQVAIPSTWVMGAIRARAKTMRLRLEPTMWGTDRPMWECGLATGASSLGGKLAKQPHSSSRKVKEE
jgi:hypothetical protein